MLLKSADSKESKLDALEHQLAVAPPDRRSWIEKDLRILKAGIKGEKDAAFFINDAYEKSHNWVIIHDLRIETRGRVAQIDHILINRFLEVFVLETKSFHAGVKINDEGEFLRWNDYSKKYEGMPSPLAQNERHLAILKEAFSSIQMPTRLGLTLTPTFQSFVLVSANARIDRSKSFDSSRVIKVDALKATIDKQIDSAGVLTLFGGVARLVDEGTLYAIGRRLTGLHTPLQSNAPDMEPVVLGATTRGSDPLPVDRIATGSGPLATARPSASTGPLAPSDRANKPNCKKCGQDDGAILYGQYGYYFKCSACDGNTSMKWDCGNTGHSPRLRKDGPNFYRECKECGTSCLFHVNQTR